MYGPMYGPEEGAAAHTEASNDYGIIATIFYARPCDS